MVGDWVVEEVVDFGAGHPDYISSDRSSSRLSCSINSTFNGCKRVVGGIAMRRAAPFSLAHSSRLIFG